MRIFISGASGYFGRNLLARLIEEGHKPLCLLRPGSESKIAGHLAHIETISGDIENLPEWKSTIGKVDAVINLIGIIREFPSRGITFRKLHVEATQALCDLASENGIGRFIQMSALGANPDSKAEYHRSKFRAEKILQNSVLEWTIMRPSLIIGPGNEALAAIIRLMKSSPLVPVVGNGRYRMQPADIDNVVEGFTRALTVDRSIGKIYDIGGPEQFSYDEMLDRIAVFMGKSIRKTHVPVSMMKIMAGMFEYFRSFPLTTGQIDMLLEENITDSKEYYSDLNIKPIGFDYSIRKALRKK